MFKFQLLKTVFSSITVVVWDDVVVDFAHLFFYIVILTACSLFGEKKKLNKRKLTALKLWITIIKRSGLCGILDSSRKEKSVNHAKFCR